MSLRQAGRTTVGRNPLLRRALPVGLVTLAALSCIKRECICPGEAGFEESAMAGARLPKGTMLLGPKGTLSFELQGATEKVSLSTVPARAQPFQEALRAEGKEVAAVKKGDLLHATFYVRRA